MGKYVSANGKSEDSSGALLTCSPDALFIHDDYAVGSVRRRVGSRRCIGCLAGLIHARAPFSIVFIVIVFPFILDIV